LSVDVSIESVSWHSPDGRHGRCWTTSDRQHHRPRNGPFAGRAVRPLAGGIPNPRWGAADHEGLSRWRKPQAGRLGRLSLSTPGVAIAGYRQGSRVDSANLRKSTRWRIAEL